MLPWSCFRFYCLEACKLENSPDSFIRRNIFISDVSISQGHNQKKRMFSESKENVKRVKTSEQINENICVALEKQTALLEQVKYWGLNICFRNFWLVKIDEG